MRLFRILLATALVLILSPLLSIQPAKAEVDVYTTPGTHQVNGRVWRTTCEPYSVTERCRTEIQATSVQYSNGKFTKLTGWTFNNLTYKPTERGIWRSNPLGGYGIIGFDDTWISDGRTWRTECDTAVSGRGGCRAYIEADVIEGDARSGYRWSTKWIFNNIVRFTPNSPSISLDADLDDCILRALGRRSYTQANLDTIRELSCDARTLEGMPRLNGLRKLGLFGQLSNLEGMPSLPNLTQLSLGENMVSFRGMPSLPKLTSLKVRHSRLTGLQGLPNHPQLKELDLWDNKITSLQGVPKLSNLTKLTLGYNEISDLKALPSLPKLRELDLSMNLLTNVSPLRTWTHLWKLDLNNNYIDEEDRAVLEPLEDAGVTITW